jgi:hypothetical protein
MLAARFRVVLGLRVEEKIGLRLGNAAWFKRVRIPLR